MAEAKISSSLKPDFVLPPLLEVEIDVPIDQNAISHIQAMVNEVKLGVQKVINNLSNFEQYSDCDSQYGFLEPDDISDGFNILSHYFSADLIKEVRAIIEKSEQLFEERCKQIKFLIENFQPIEINIGRIVEIVQKGSIEDYFANPLVPYDQAAFNSVFFNLLENPSLKLIHVVRLLMLIRQIYPERNNDDLIISEYNSNNNSMVCQCEEFLTHYRNTHQSTFGLRELAAIFTTLGLNPDAITEVILAHNQYSSVSPFLNWPDEAIWPYFADKLDFLENLLNPQFSSQFYGHDKTQRAKMVLPILEKFPQPSEQFLSKLWKMALGTSTIEMPLAQRCLNKHPNTKVKIIETLKKREQSVRSTAAKWIGKLNDSTIIPELKELIKTEKSDIVKDDLMRSLEKLGASVDEFLNLAGLLKEAQTGLKKGIPEALSWFPFARLPVIHCPDTNKPIEPEIITWFIVQYYKQKMIEPSPMLWRYVEYFKPKDREALGQFVLESWIAQDTLSIDTSAKARQAQFKGSAIKEKGILAVSAACCGAAAVPLIENYLKTYYGYRIAQCSALLQVLDWLENFSAIQLLLSVANRFRTKKIQLEAEWLVHQLAERKGWTKDELSDRTIPYCGFSDQEKMVLDYGSRQFTARLDKDFNFILTDSSGKVIKSLPEARKEEDVEQVKATKKQFLEAKKQLKQVLISQQERLYEAMCIQRSWKFEDWNTFLNKHPIMGKYCQRLVWLVIEQEQVIQTFRPLEDGTLTDENDEEVIIKPEAMVRIAHASLLAPEKIKAWRSHLSDYEIVPLFEQFGTVYELSEELKQQTEIKDFEGHLIESFQLRSQATKLGYLRGENDDHGWFFYYKKMVSWFRNKSSHQFYG